MPRRSETPLRGDVSGFARELYSCMSCTVKSRETSNPAMDTEVWRLVLEESSTAAGVKLAAMVAIAARTWAASPPDGVMATSPCVTSVTKSVVTLGASAPSTGSGALVEGPWGVVLSQDEKDRAGRRQESGRARAKSTRC